MNSTDPQDLQDLETRLLRGIKMVQPRADECLPGTRTTILANVASNTNTCDGSNIICILGAPGSGKSSISLTAKSRLRRQRQLVTYYRFDRNEAAVTTPTALWRCVAYDLARRLPAIRTQLLEQLREDEVDLDSPMDVFTSLIENSLLNDTSTIHPPLVIIIDALDECGGLAGQFSRDRQMLLQTLRRWARLPKQFKLLVTSRPEGDITRALSDVSTQIDIPSGHSITENPEALPSIDASNDIRMFLEGRFQAIRQRLPSLPAEWPGSETIDEMIHRAAGIFMWATTAVNFIDLGINPRGRLRKIMDDTSDSSSMRPLYLLYAVVLEMGFGEIPSNGLELEILQSVLGTMVLAKRPLDDNEYTMLPTTEPITEDMLDGIRDHLRSVIAPGSLRFVHKSFDDFLLSEECPPKYAIKKDQTHYILTKLCLATMTKELCFNLCSLETSCLKNVDVPNIETKVMNCISTLLSYSCLFFADHLILTPFDEYLMREVEEMILDKLLFWLETMSLLKEINRVPPSLLLVLKWLHISPGDEFKDFLHDACRFIGAFGIPIAQGAPHVYISALPFAPENSSVAKHFLPKFHSILTFSTGKPTNWSSCIFTSEYHADKVTCVAFSADEKQFVSGSDDFTICICDSETGNLISGPFECGDRVHSVCFDPSGTQVWASCRKGEIICWNIETGDELLVIDTSYNYKYPNRFHCRIGGSQTIISSGRTIALWNRGTGRCEQDYDWKDEAYEEYTLTSISPDGCYIALVAGQFGTTIKMWKVVNGSQLQGPVDSHPQFEHPKPITALSFSVDSKFAVSGSEDGTVLIWDVCTGDTVRPLFSAGFGEVGAVAFSPKNYLVVARHFTMMVLNATTGECLGVLNSPSVIVDIALSRDGQRVLIVYDDKTVRMWDVGRNGGVLVANENRTHTAAWDVAFSPCGKKLAWFDNCWITGWDANTGKSLFYHDLGTDYDRLIFSPDGSQVAAYDTQWGSGSIGIWIADTGALVSKINVNDEGRSKFTRIEHVAFRSTDGVLILCSNHGVVRTWNIKDGDSQIIAELPFIVALSPDGLTAIVGDDQRSPCCYVWSTTTHLPLPLILADDEHISGFPVAYSPSGRFFASLDDSDQTLRVWNMQTGGLAVCFSTHSSTDSLALSPNDHHIAIGYDTPSSCGQIQVFDACTGQLISGPWSGHTSSIPTLAFSPDGKSLASGSWDGQVRIWNVPHMIGDSQLSLSNSAVPTHMEDGWVKDVGGNLLFWVPMDYRVGLVWPHSVPLVDSETMTELDMSRFKYGGSWTECFSRGDVVGEKTTGP